MKLLITFAIFLLICVPAIVLSVPVVAVMLHTAWDGRSTIFGNRKWGRATNHFSSPTKGYWQEFMWLVYRNPVNNLMTHTLAANRGNASLHVRGDSGIGDKVRGGVYCAWCVFSWEYYWVIPYKMFGVRRCIRARMGWKLVNSDSPAAFVFAFNPIKPYSGV